MTEFTKEFFQRHGRRGGEVVRKKYGKAYFRKLASLSATARKKRREDGSLKTE